MYLKVLYKLNKNNIIIMKISIFKSKYKIIYKKFMDLILISKIFVQIYLGIFSQETMNLSAHIYCKFFEFAAALSADL